MMASLRARLRVLFQPVAAFAAQFRLRLRDRRFWVTQALVLAVTGAHTAAEARGVLEGHPHEALYFVPVLFYLVPVLYAALNFGLEGAVPTAVWSGVMATPNLFLWHGESFMWLGEVLQLLILVGVAVVVAHRVEAERQQKERAEASSGRLSFLNTLAAAITQSLDVERTTAEALDRIVKRAPVRGAWLCLHEETFGEHRRVDHRFAPADLGLDAADAIPWHDLCQRIATSGKPYHYDGCPELARRNWSMLVVPLQVEERIIGALGAIVEGQSPLPRDDLELFEAAGREVAMALDNARLYQAERQAVAALSTMQENLRAYMRQATYAQEEERKRIARELHDETAQALALLSVSLKELAGQKWSSKEATARLGELQALTEEVLEGVRRFSRDLRPSMLDDLGLVAAVEWLTADLIRRRGIDARLEITGAQRWLPPEVALTLFRIVQEALRNVEKHSEASQVLVSMAFEDGRLCLSVRDNGKGFEQPPSLNDLVACGKLGLVGMQERAQLLGGTLDLQAEVGKGTCVAATFRC